MCWPNERCHSSCRHEGSLLRNGTVLNWEKTGFFYSHILCFIDPASLHNFGNKSQLLNNFLVSLFLSLHVPFDYVPIIRGNNCIYVTIGICYSLWRTVRYAGWNETPPCIPDIHPYRLTSNKCHINTVISPNDGHIVARNS